MTLPADYLDRVYAGVLGKIIGVYLGRPFEGWTHERIMAELGEVAYYVNDRRDLPLKNHTLVVADDDISGTFTFLRALPDYGNDPAVTPAQIGQTWLNYLIEGKTVLWWGGRGNSTEHTAYLRLLEGMPAPRSGAAATNGRVVAEQVGAQIFADGWAMVAPGDPERAADFARRAASVSHDGEAIYAAQALAAMESLAFLEADRQALLDCALRAIPEGCTIARLIHDLREWHAGEPEWLATRARVEARYGYERFGGNCHVVPNHALILLGLLYGDGRFGRSLAICASAGWDTDCNAGNLGCLLGIKNGLAGLEDGGDWRGPVADRLYLPTADGGRAISDAVQETYHVANIGRALQGQEPLAPKGGARFHFELPGSTQGFTSLHPAAVRLENVAGHSTLGTRSLALHVGGDGRAGTATFIPPEAMAMPEYELLASPILYPGQLLRAALAADAANGAPLSLRLMLQVYAPDDTLQPMPGPQALLAPGARQTLVWRIPDTGGAPIATVGLELHTGGETSGTVYLDYLTWDGTPEATFRLPGRGGTMWRRAWVRAVDLLDDRWADPYRLVQNRGRGLLIQGTREWRDYTASATITPHMAAAWGLAARVQGLRRYYALLLCAGGLARLVKFDDVETTLAEVPFLWELGEPYALQLQVQGSSIRGRVDGTELFHTIDDDRPLLDGALALVCEEGRVATDAVTVGA